MHSLTSAPLLFDLKIYRLLEVTRFWPPLNFPDINNELFYPLQTGNMWTESSRPDISKGVSRSSVSAGCECGDGVNGVFFILRLTRSTVSWRALSWAKPVRKPSIFTMTTVSQVPPGRVCVCTIFECYVWKLIWGMCVFGFSVSVCGGRTFIGGEGVWMFLFASVRY